MFLMAPIAEHSYTIKVLEKIYKARTRDDKLMDPMSHVQTLKKKHRRSTNKEK
jgi:hypothetical protein